MNASSNIRAGLYMALSMAGFSINDALIKSLGGAITTSQIIAVRGFFLFVLIALLLFHGGYLNRSRQILSPLIGLRALMELLATLTFLTALTQLPFATISAILQALPLLVTLGAVLFFGEKVGPLRWMAIFVGLLGVLIIIRPGTDGFQAVSLLMLASVLFAAVRDLFTRALPVAIPSLLVAGATTTLLMLFGAGSVWLQGSWVALQFEQWLRLAVAAGFLLFGYLFIIMAMRTGDVAYVVPFRYTSLLWAVGLGYFLFDEVPDFYTMLGSIIVVSMGLFTLYREIVTRPTIADSD